MPTQRQPNTSAALPNAGLHTARIAAPIALTVTQLKFVSGGAPKGSWAPVLEAVPTLAPKGSW